MKKNKYNQPHYFTNSPVKRYEHMISGIFTSSVQEQHVFGVWEEEIVHLVNYFDNIQLINHIERG